MTNEQFLSTGDVAKRFGVTPITVTRWCNQRKIKARKIAGGKWQIPLKAVEAFERASWNMPPDEQQGETKE